MSRVSKLNHISVSSWFYTHLCPLVFCNNVAISGHFKSQDDPISGSFRNSKIIPVTIVMMTEYLAIQHTLKISMVDCNSLICLLLADYRCSRTVWCMKALSLRKIIAKKHLIMRRQRMCLANSLQEQSDLLLKLPN